METFYDKNVDQQQVVAVVVDDDGGGANKQLIDDGDKLIVEQPLLYAAADQVVVGGYINPIPTNDFSLIEKDDAVVVVDTSVEHVKLLPTGCTTTTDDEDKPPPPPYEVATDPLTRVTAPCHTRRSNTCENCGQVVRDVAATTIVGAIESTTDAVVGGSMSKANSGDSISTCSLQVDFCRICHCEADSEMGRLIAPCKCKGTLRNVHQACLQQWIKSSDCKHCELCGFHFAMNTKLKPISKWEKLSMSTSERRKIMCSVIFHLVAITCVVWSLYVLIERTADELHNRKLQWPFWTKLVVVAIGFAGGLVFMYVQCKIYVQLWRRLKAFNRIIYVQHQPSSPQIDDEGRRQEDDDDDIAEVLIVGTKSTTTTTAVAAAEATTSFQHGGSRQEEVVLVEVASPQT